jgi:hypothetical protein
MLQDQQYNPTKKDVTTHKGKFLLMHTDQPSILTWTSEGSIIEHACGIRNPPKDTEVAVTPAD